MLNTHLFERKYHETNPLSHGALRKRVNGGRR